MIAAEAPPSASAEAVMRSLRRARRRMALAVALADIGGAWPLEAVTAALTAFAETAIGAAVAHLLASAASTGEIALPYPDDPARGSGFVVLGMGKLGARELNYSSDIDLILLFDDERLADSYTGKRSPQEFFVRLARDLVRLLEERTADGYVFRTDLRLRPDPGSTPPVLSMLAAETYYESTGQNWERAAMIKARPVAGDLAAGQRFLDLLRPFVWRKSLDFAAIQDIHSIKRQINAHRGGARIAVAGHNIKLGRGGIREIEFFAQTQQLIWGGREPALRTSRTCEALQALADSGHISADVPAKLIDAYRFLRTLEHRLQMAEDRQTHQLPSEPGKLAQIAKFMGFPDTDSFAATVLRVLRTVEDEYAGLFEEAPELGGGGALVFTGAEDHPDTLQTLTALGFREPSAVSAAVRAWHHGRYRAMRSTRARELLTEIMPALLGAFGKTVDPDGALMRFDEFL
jgi:glutamate-ammonia-ligase adenylyltransferase